MASADTSSLWTGVALDGIGWWAVQLFHYTRGGHRSFFWLIAYQLIFFYLLNANPLIIQEWRSASHWSLQIPEVHSSANAFLKKRKNIDINNKNIFLKLDSFGMCTYNLLII